MSLSAGLRGGLFVLLLSALINSALALPEIEENFRNHYFATPISVTGMVVDVDGNPLANALITLQNQTASSDSGGQFHFAGLARNNAALTISASGFHTSITYIHLLRPLADTTVIVEPIVLSAADNSTVRFLFGGDTSFGRRFLDPDETTPTDQLPPDNPDAFIQVSNPLPGTRTVTQFIQPYFQTADFAVVNLESPVTDNPATPHPTKAFAFFTLPGSLPALPEMGVDYVSLGNNHLYDYLELGTIDTLAALDQAGIPFSGAGLNTSQALLPYRTTLNGTDYSLLSATSVSGSQHAISYVAEDSKGGAADARQTDEVIAAIESENAAGYAPIMQLHVGKEYTFEPSANAAGRMQTAVDAGAALVISHHPHVAQGFDYQQGTLIAHSLGNFIFDQARLETMLGLVAQVDMRGATADHVIGLPVYTEDFRPRPITGQLANVFLRRIAEFSTDRVQVFPYNGKAWVLPDDNQTLTTYQTNVTVEVDIPAAGWAVLDLRGLAPSEASLTHVQGGVGLTAHLGRDLLNHGNFEDLDVDDENLELSRWDVSSDSRFACLHAPWRGAVAICSSRSSSNSSDSVISFRNRTRVMGDADNAPNRNLTLFGYARGDNAGPLKIITRYYASTGSNQFGEQAAFTHPGGSFAWQPFAADLALPPDAPDISDPSTESARAVRLFMRHSPPSDGDGLASFDDIALINWEAEQAANGLNLERSQPFEFIRLVGTPGRYALTLSFSQQRPSAVTAYIDEPQPNYSSVWWDANQSGQGIQLLHGDNVLAGAWYVYDEQGQGMWLTFASPFSGTTTSFDLLRYTGPALGTTWDAAQVVSQSAGSATITFTSPTTATFTYTLNGVPGTLNLTPFDPAATGVYSKVWFDPAQSGQGVQLLHSGNNVTGAWYLYDQQGRDLWVTFSGDLSANTISSELYRFTGPKLGNPWNVTDVASSSIGSVSIQFQSADSALFNYSVDGVTGSLNLVPFPF